MLDDIIHQVAVSVEGPRRKFGYWLVDKMDHCGLVLYLILCPETLELLAGAEPIGLEVNLPTGPDVYLSTDMTSHVRRQPRIDLVFRQGNGYCLVEVKDRKPSAKDLKYVRKYIRRFKEILGEYGQSLFPITPIIVYPEYPEARAKKK